jgi:hypothetical protein
MFSFPYTDPELADWIRWACESGEVPMFIRAIAVAASIADLPHYALLRPVLLELMRERPPTAALGNSNPPLNPDERQAATTIGWIFGVVEARQHICS